MALSTLAARRALALVAAVMHVPAVHATLLEQQGLLQPPTTPSVIMVTAHIRPFVKCHSACVPNSSSINALRSSRAVWCSNQAAVKADHLNLYISCQLTGVVCMAVQAHLSKPLLQAVRQLLAVLLSCAGGLDLLLRSPIPTGALLKALDPANDPYGPPLPQNQEPARWGRSFMLLPVELITCRDCVSDSMAPLLRWRRRFVSVFEMLIGTGACPFDNHVRVLHCQRLPAFTLHQPDIRF